MKLSFKIIALLIEQLKTAKTKGCDQGQDRNHLPATDQGQGHKGQG